jgi:hypothetical protein
LPLLLALCLLKPLCWPCLPVAVAAPACSTLACIPNMSCLLTAVLPPGPCLLASRPQTRYWALLQAPAARRSCLSTSPPALTQHRRASAPCALPPR